MDSEERSIFAECWVNANLKDVWEAWATVNGVKTFFAPECKLDFVRGGAYEMYFAPDSPPGSRGGEGCRILAIQPLKMFSFTWNAPPSLPNVRTQFTHVVLRFTETPDNTRVTLSHDGWGTGDEWDKAHAYFNFAWKKVVLPRLVYRFNHGPINWQNPPDLIESEI